MERSAQAHVAVRAMAAGIQNLLFTDVRSAADAEACVRIAKPEVPGSIGTHGNDGGRAAIGGVAELIKRYEDSVIVLMIEKKGAVEDLEAILRVKGVDMVQFGPSDYGISIGFGGQREHPAVIEAREYTIKTAIKMGVVRGLKSARRRKPSTTSTWASKTSTCRPTRPFWRRSTGIRAARCAKWSTGRANTWRSAFKLSSSVADRLE